MKKLLVLICLLAACSTAQKKVDPVSADEQFSQVAGEFYWSYVGARPSLGVYLGYHQFDGKLADVSAAALLAEVQRLKEAQEALGDFDPASLSPLHQIERDCLLFEIRSELFDLESFRQPYRNPSWYGWNMSVSNYVEREYDTKEHRAQAIIDVAGGFEKFVTDMEANLEANMPEPWVATGLLQTRGNIQFLQEDVPREFQGLSDPRLQQKLGTAIEHIIKQLQRHAAFLEERKKTATNEYALGETQFLKMLAETQGVAIDLNALETVARADLARNLEAMEAAARKIDPDKTTAEVVAMVAAKKPPVDGVIALGEAQAKQMRQFLIDNKIVTIPSDDVAEVRPSPPFMRWNFAFLSGAGPFEKKKLKSFYYISPPDPKWSKEDQLAYIPGKTDLLAVTIHELWPGHFLHGLHSKQVESPILKSFWNYAMGEGWAHYTEEMMVNHGVGNGDPEVRIGQLLNALLRDVRFLSAIGLHARGMSVEASEKMFIEKAFQDPGNARQQATRGTRDPMYLSYTLGKLMIMKLRKDWEAQEGDKYTLQRFHDTFLSYGGAPVPVIRKAMLTEDSGELL